MMRPLAYGVPVIRTAKWRFASFLRQPAGFRRLTVFLRISGSPRRFCGSLRVSGGSWVLRGFAECRRQSPGVRKVRRMESRPCRSWTEFGIVYRLRAEIGFVPDALQDIFAIGFTEDQVTSSGMFEGSAGFFSYLYTIPIFDQRSHARIAHNRQECTQVAPI